MLGGFFYLGCQDEVIFGQSIRRMRKDTNADFAPGEINIRMMTDFLGDFANFVGKAESLPEIFKFKSLFEIVTIDDLPALSKLFLKFFYLIWGKRLAAVARFAFFSCKFIHRPSCKFIIERNGFPSMPSLKENSKLR